MLQELFLSKKHLTSFRNVLNEILLAVWKAHTLHIQDKNVMIGDEWKRSGYILVENEFSLSEIKFS